MSSRHMRRLMALKEQQKQKESEESGEDEDAEPSAQQSQTFHGLEVSSDSESEKPALGDPIPSTSPIPGPSTGVQQHRSANIPEEDKYGAKKKTFTKAQIAKKEKMAQKESKKNKQFKIPEGIDEVDWLTEQLNQKLGDPPQRVGEMVVDKREQRKNQLFYINPDHLNVNNELAKVYGRNETKSPYPLNRRASHWIGVSPNIQAIRIKGIVMTRYKTEGRIKYFRFTHNQEYRTRCELLIREIVERSHGGGNRATMLYSLTCIEACLENCDILYTLEEHNEGRISLEQCLFCLQFVADPSFSYVDGNTRLLYEFVENRPFHIALLKYVHILSNTACHITALALGKVLLSLDPTDPLAVSFIIDTLAIRAREFKWLIGLVEEWRDTGHTNRLFNMRYSRALALFHIARRTQEGEVEADAALSKAIMSYPSVALKIINLAKISVPDDIKNHALFNPPANYPVPSRDLQQLINFYAWLMAPRWQEPFVSKWFIKILSDTITQYNESSALREKAFSNARLVAQLYLYLPTEIIRHLYIIRSMSSYIGGGHMQSLPPSVSFNPFPMRGSRTDTYNYFTENSQRIEPNQRLLMGFLEGLFPNVGRLGTGTVAAGGHSRDIRGTELIDHMNQNQISMIRLRADEVSLGNGDYAPALVQQFFYAGYNADLPGPSAQSFEVEEVEVTYRCAIEENIEYLAVVFLTDEEKEVPMITTKLIIIQYIVAIQLMHYHKAGEFIRGRRNAPLDREDTFEEPPIE